MAMDKTQAGDQNPTPTKQKSTRSSKLKKHADKLLAASLIATSLMLGACGEKDCVTVYRQPGQPASSSFTGTNQPAGQTYCYGTESRYYGSSYVYVGSYGGSTG
jgi:hypothetical protein